MKENSDIIEKEKENINNNESVQNLVENKQGEQRQFKRQREGKRNFNRENRDNKERSDRENFRNRRIRKKVCLLCKEKNYILDYKDAETLRKFINEKGKILPRRATGTCARHQREIAKVVKRARHIGVLPYTID